MIMYYSHFLCKVIREFHQHNVLAVSITLLLIAANELSVKFPGFI